MISLKTTNRLFPGIILAVFFMMFGSCQIYRTVEDSGPGINSYSQIPLGGISQAVMVRGDNARNPVMIFLHGGPGFPLFPFEPNEEIMKRLEEDFIMVYWEQRGTGRSFNRSLSPRSMTLDQFVEDTRQLVDYLKELTGQQKVFIWGHSWGTNIGTLFAARYPGLVHAYISTGQSVNPIQNERLNYEFVLQKALQNNNRRALRQLARIDTVASRYTLQDALTLRKWVYRYGGVVRDQSQERPYFDLQELQQTLSSPFYSFQDRFNMVLFPFFSARSLWKEMKGINLKKRVPRLEVPVYFLLGRHDMIVSASLAASYFDALEAPLGKTLIWFEESAHRPHSEEQEKFLSVFRNRIISEVLAQPPPIRTSLMINRP